MGFLLSTITAGLLYYISCKVWPVQTYPPQREQEPKSWEFMRHTEGFFPGDDFFPTNLAEELTLYGKETIIGSKDHVSKEAGFK